MRVRYPRNEKGETQSNDVRSILRSYEFAERADWSANKNFLDALEIFYFINSLVTVETFDKLIPRREYRS